MRLGLLILCLALTACSGAKAPRFGGADWAGAIWSGGEPSAPEVLRARLDEADMICVGERHDRPLHHKVQWQLLRYLSRTTSADRGHLALGLEMVGRQHQAVLDDYAAGRIDMAGLRRSLRWRKTWGYDFRMYAPMFRLSHRRGHRLLGLNAPKALTRSVARHGLGSLPRSVRRSLPQLDLGVSEHRAFFWSVMGFGSGGGKHGHMASRAENFYTAQVIWDETMAEGAASWQAGKPRRKVMVIAGNGHCHRSAIVGRFERRVPSSKTVAIAILDEGASPMPHTKNDFVIRVPAPEERRSAAAETAAMRLLHPFDTDVLVASRR